MTVLNINYVLLVKKVTYKYLKKNKIFFKDYKNLTHSHDRGCN